MKQPLLIATISAILFTASGVAHAVNHAGHKKPDISRVYHSLDLTATQHDQIKQIITSARSTNDQKSDRHHAEQRFNFDNENAFLAAFSEHSERRKDTMLVRAKARHEIYQLLSASQQQALTEKLTRKPDRRKKAQPPKDRLPAHYAALNLSDAQTLAITAIVRAGDEIKQDTNVIFRRLKNQERAIIHAEVFNEEAWQDWFNAYTEEKRAAALSRFHRKNGLMAQLTPAQTALLADLRHAPERDRHRGRRR